MKILVYHWNSYNQKAAVDALSECGCSITPLTMQTGHIDEDEKFTNIVYEKLRQHKYNMLFSINFFPVLAQACHMADTPYVCWNCDSPLLAMYNNSVFYETNFIFTFDRSNYEEFKNLGVKHIYHLPLASCGFKDILSTSAPFVYDVSFIGSLYEKNSFDNISEKLPDYLCGYFDGALYAQLQVSGGNIIEKLLTPGICRQLEEITDYKQADGSFADIHTLFSTTVLGFKAASMQRNLYLNSLSVCLNQNTINNRKSFLHLFTGSSTDRLLLVKCHGKADYYTQMPLIFKQSKINLNMTIPNIQTGIPLRAWDILSCGGFLLTDFRIELMDYFTPGKDIDIFEDIEELQDKTCFYLGHDSIRNKIASNAYNKVSKEHTCKKRIMAILETVLKEL